MDLPHIRVVELARPVMRLLSIAGALALLACGREPSVGDAGSHAPPLTALEYEFVLSSVGTADSAQALELASWASGRVTLTLLDDPPLLVGSLVVDQMELRSHDQMLVTATPGDWPFLARRGNNGSVDALWLDNEIPGEATSLLRFLIGELQTAAPGAVVRQEQTPAGVLEAGYVQSGLPWLQLGLRVRRSPTSSVAQVRAGAVFASDYAGVRRLVSVQRTHASFGAEDDIASSSMLLARRVAVTDLADVDMTRLREQIERLSASPPVSLAEQPLSKAQKDAMRRETESWDSVMTRLLSAGDPADPSLLGRAAAYLIEDEALVRELLEFVRDPSTPRMGVNAMLEALGECGTLACQDGLLAALEFDEALRAASLAALTRVVEPTAKTVDRLLEICEGGDEVAHASVGIVLARFAEHDAEGAAARVREIVDGFDGCPAALERWFGLLGNAGSSAAQGTLLECFSDPVPAQRRAAAAAALRRMPGEEVTRALVELVAEEPGAVRLAGLRALFSRELSDEELALLASAGVRDWGAPELNSLLDVIERVADPSSVARELAGEIGRSPHEEVARRAQLLRDHLN
jgi:hypothetical protein